MVPILYLCLNQDIYKINLMPDIKRYVAEDWVAYVLQDF